MRSAGNRSAFLHVREGRADVPRPKGARLAGSLHSGARRWVGLDFASGHGVLEELAQAVSAIPGWQKTVAALRSAERAGATQEQLLTIARDGLAELGFTAEGLRRAIPPEHAARVSDSEIAHMGEAFEALMLSTIFEEGVTGQPRALPASVAGGVSVSVESTPDGHEIPVVQAFATPFRDPEEVIAEFADACYRTFDAEAFAHRAKSARDAEWWKRYVCGESFRAIALSDPRSGLAPEAANDETEYADEIARATDRVRRAVRRIRRRWTPILDSVSKEAG